MIIKYLSTFFSVILTPISLLSAPIGDSYTISMPMHIDLCDSGSFNVELIDNNLSDSDTIDIYFDDSFTLQDKHGKPNISGSVINSHISFNKDDQAAKTVYYSVNNASVGQWSGNLNVSISLDRKAQENILQDGNSINNILLQLDPSTITFSHDNVVGDYLCDLSTAQDESILLYKNGGDVIITNKQNIPIVANEDMSNLFKNLNVTAINNLNYIDMSTCHNMSGMFNWDNNLATLDVSSFDTSNVTDMSYMFESMQKCSSIIGLENFDVSNVETIAHLLSYTYGLQTVPDLSGWTITDKCRDISYAFNCVGYTVSKTNTSKWDDGKTYDFSNWDVSNVENMSHTFANAFKLKYLDLSEWDTSSVVDMSSMFEMTDTINKSSLTAIYGIENFNVNNVTDMSYMFHECRSLVADLSLWQPNSVENLTHTFYDTRYLDIRVTEAWANTIANNSTVYTDCFNNYSGYYIQRNYKPTWYK